MTHAFRWLLMTVALVAVAGLGQVAADAADTSEVDAATKQIESGAKKIGAGVEEAAKGIGNTVVEGAKVTSKKLKEAGKAAEPPAKTGWERINEGFSSFGSSAKNFFGSLFGR